MQYWPIFLLIIILILLAAYLYWKNRETYCPNTQRLMYCFTKSGCHACDIFKPTWKQFENNMRGNWRVNVKEVNVDYFPNVAKKYGVTMFPDVVAIFNGKVIASIPANVKQISYADLQRLYMILITQHQVKTPKGLSVVK